MRRVSRRTRSAASLAAWALAAATLVLASVSGGSATAWQASVPSQPTGVNETVGNAEATLSWADPSDSSITGYEYDLHLQIPKLAASGVAAGDFFGWSVAVDGDTMVVGAPFDDAFSYGSGQDRGSAHVFTRQSGVWSHVAKLTASDAAAYDYFGLSVAVDGGTVVVGAYGDGADVGSVYVFSEPVGGWASVSGNVKLTASDAAASDRFGFSVAVDGGTVVVGAYGDGADVGSVYVFSEPVGGWASVSGNVKLTASDAAASDRFGFSVAVDGGTVVVGAYGDGADVGSVYVFSEPVGGWASVSGNVKLTASDAAASDRFGFSVAVDGGTVVVGAYGDGADVGSVYVFSEPVGGWASVSGNVKLTASDAAASDRFGISVAVDGGTVVVGADRDGAEVGSVYVFSEPVGGWASVSGDVELTASDAATSDYFGRSVAVDGGTVVVGVYGDDDGGLNSGSAYVDYASGWSAIPDSAPGGTNATSYTVAGFANGEEHDFGLRIRAKNGTGVSDASAVATLVAPDRPTGLTAAVSDGQVSLGWDDPSVSTITGYEYDLLAEVAKLTAFDADALDSFGWSVAVESDTMVVGAQLDDDADSASGAAHVFVRQSGVWGHAAKLTASDGALGDRFGYSVAIGGDTIIIGSPRDNDGGSDSGSVYVFTKPAGGWATASGNVKLTAFDAAAHDYFGWSVAIDGDTVVVGAHGDDDGGSVSGSVYVFTKPAGGWATASGNVKLTASNPAMDDYFGTAVAVDGDTIVVAVASDDDGGTDSGSVYVFTKPAGGWATVTGSVKLTAADADDYDYFGISVAVDGGTVVVGAYRDDDVFSDSGSVYVFTKPAGGLGDGQR